MVNVPLGSEIDIRLTATPMRDLIDPELFACDLCCSIVTNPQQHFIWHQSLLVNMEGVKLYEPFMIFPGRPAAEKRTDVHIPGPDLADLVDQHLPGTPSNDGVPPDQGVR